MTASRARVPDSSPTAPRALGLWSATALVVGHTIGVGIFLTPAQLVGALASPALTLGLWIGCAALVLAGALTFGELASRDPRGGGLYVYLRRGSGERAAFLYGWLSLLVMDPGVLAALVLGVAPYVSAMWPPAAGHERAVALGILWALALANLAGLRPSSRILNGLTAFKVLLLAAFVAGAFAVGAGTWSHFSPFFARRAGAPPLSEALGLGVIGAFYSFGGFWEASRVAGEVRDPERVLPRALALGVCAVTAVYLLTTVSFLYLVAPGQAATASEFAQRAGEALLGPGGPPALGAVVVLSVVASAMALLLMAPRLYLAMSRDGLFPSWLARPTRRTGAPARATVLLAAIASIDVLSGSFSQVVALFLCPTLLFVALAAAALFVVRRRDSAVPAFRVPGFPATPALFIVFLLAVVVLAAVARPIPALAGFGLVLLGLPAHELLARKRDRRAASAEGDPQ
jgi:APA family basic amino acid/polyamine antiporter